MQTRFLLEEELNINESSDKSTIDKNHKKFNYNNKRFKKLSLNDKNLINYIDDELILKEFDTIKILYKGIFIIDTLNNKVAGYGLVLCKYITPIYIYEEYRGIGIGKEILKELVNKYNARNLEVYNDNKVAIKMYENFGFKKVFSYKDGYSKGKDILNFMTLNKNINNLSLTFKNNFKDVKNIVDSLNKKDFNHICKNKEFIDSPYKIYSMVLSNNSNDPICFVECYKFPMKDYGEVIFACKEKYRGIGIMTYLLFLFLNSIDNKKINKLVFYIDKDNESSLKLIKKIFYQKNYNPKLNSEGQYMYEFKL